MVSKIPSTRRIGLTFCKMRHEAVGRFMDEVTFSRNADGCQNVVSSAHHLPDPSFRELVENPSSTRLQLVLKYNESDKVHFRLSILPVHFLYFYPVQLSDMLGSASDHSKATMCIVGQEVLVVTGNYTFYQP